MENTFVNVLPENFTGVFYFTNPSEEDFTGFWGKRGYLYPAMKTTPMVIFDATPLEVQNIRKKFARELAEREFFKSDKAQKLQSQEILADGTPRFKSFKNAALYTDSDLKEYIQRCLESLPLAQQTVVEVPTVIDVEERMSVDDDGERNTQIAVKGRPLSLKDKESKAV